jgi:hypothetical protein
MAPDGPTNPSLTDARGLDFARCRWRNTSVVFARCFALAAIVGVTVGATPSAPAAERHAVACAVTVVSPRTRPPAQVPRSFDYGNGLIAIDLNPPDGHLIAGRLRTGGERAEINRDGSISAKYGWWRTGDRLRISGHRLDAAASPLIADIPKGYSAGGWQATGLTYPTTGCWRVTGAVGHARLSFTVRVTKSPLGPYNP